MKGKTGKKKARPAARRSGGKTAPGGPLDPAEWDFSQVPAAELPACFLWEYARESAWILDLARRCQEHPLHTPEGEAFFAAMDRKFSTNPPKRGVKIPEWRDDFETPEGKRWMADLVTVAGATFPRYIDRTVHYFLSEWIQDGLILTPWQSLSEKVRAYILQSAAELDAACNKPLLNIVELEDESSPYFYPRRTLKGRLMLDPRNHFQWLHTFLISWETHTNKQIAAAFLEWLNKARPLFSCKPSRNGDKKKDRRAWLKWLGTMRALHRFTFADHKFPAPLRCGGDSKKAYSLRTKARKKFREMFQDLPKREDPISWPTAGRKSP